MRLGLSLVLAGLLCIVPGVRAEDAPTAAPGDPDLRLLAEGRAALTLPDDVWRDALGAVGFEGRALGYSAEDMAHYGETPHTLGTVKRLFRDIRRVPAFSGRVSRLLLESADRPGALARIAYRLLDVSAGRGVTAPKGDDWGVDWIPKGTSPFRASEACQRRVAEGEPFFTTIGKNLADWSNLPEPVQRLVVRILVAGLEIRESLEGAFGFDPYRFARTDAGPPSSPDFLDLVRRPFREETAPRMSYGLYEGLDMAFLAYASIRFLTAVDAAIREWRESGPVDVGDFDFCTFDTPLGAVGVFGPGPDRITAGFALVVDLGGNDVHVGGRASPQEGGTALNVIVDLGGDDEYDSGDADTGFACGAFGIGAIFDLAGDDHYRCAESGLGAAWMGTGLLLDYAGNDSYDTGKWGQGAAHGGVGMLVDLAGDDQYTCKSESQGFGGTRGVGILLDVAGNDSYVADLNGNVEPIFRGQSVSFAQGAAYGRRADFGDGHGMAGGIGMLVDGAGDDSYVAGVYGQGAGYWWGLGCLEDRSGNDTYSAVQYSQGSAPHMAIGSCIDLAGDDRYNLETENLYMQSQGCARDGSLAVFIDGSGNDRYRNGNRSAGSGEVNAIGLFWDRCGDDRYVCERGTPAPTSRSYGGVGARKAEADSWRSEVPTAGVFLDTGGFDRWKENRAEDSKAPPLEARNDATWRHEQRDIQQSVGIDTERFVPPPPVPVVDDERLTIHRFETTCNSYFLTCKATRKFVVIDAGARLWPQIRAHAMRGHELTALWVTHDHGDHLSGLGEMAVRTKIPVVAHLAGREAIQGTIDGWKDWGMTDVAPRPPVLPTVWIEDGATMTVGRLEGTALFAPGHSVGSVLFLMAGDQLFSGDVLFKNSVGRTDFPGCDPERFDRSLSEKLWDLADGIHVYPGHMDRTTMGEEKRTNWLFQDAVRRARGEPPIPRPWLGVQLDREHPGPGLRLEEVVPGSPAEKAGLKAGDLVMRFGSRDLDSIEDLIAVIRGATVGTTLTVGVRRGDETPTLAVTLGSRPTDGR